VSCYSQDFSILVSQPIIQTVNDTSTVIFIEHWIMKILKKLTLTLLLVLIASAGAFAQNAAGKVQALHSKYGDIPNYKLNITYESVNDRMGFANTQVGTLVVQGDRYILNFGEDNTETWMSDGRVEHIGTIELDHSQYIRYCDGENAEAIIDYGSILTFYGSDHAGTMDGNMLSLKPTGDAPYVSLMIETSGNDIKSIMAVDDFGTSHKYTLSGFSTNTAGTKFTINPGRYFEKIDERSSGCK